MYKFLLFFALFFSATSGNAQSRLIGEARYSYTSNNGYVLRDTIALSYSWGHHSMPEECVNFYTKVTWAADHITTWHIDSATGQQYNSARIDQEFDADGRLITQVDHQLFNNVLDTNYIERYQYNNGIIDTVYVWQGNNFYRFSSVYDTNGLLTVRYRNLWNGNTNAFMNNARDSFKYLSGELVREQQDLWDGSAWLPEMRYDYAYSGNNVSEMMISEYDAGWEALVKSLYTYTLNGDIETREDQSASGNTFIPGYRWTYTYNNNDQLMNMSMEDHVNGQLVPLFAYVYAYNNAGLVDTRHLLTWNGSQFSTSVGDNRKIRYYYEQITPTSISKNANNNTQLQIFPNPATNTLNISMMTAHTSPFSITIYDATGCSVRHWNEPPSTFYQKQIDVSQLASGNYFLRLSDRPQEAVQFTIVK